jgi:NADH-quinone oxidoreductase subunit L
MAIFLFCGAVGKSAQFPLQSWLGDAMAGPTPVSALIHAATMVTAGVYLIARTHVLFELSPFALDLVGIIGTATLLLAGFCALAQSDIKRVLAYSTMSQIGYMFLALGIGAYPVAIFHLMTHAFFKALLFLAAGSIILATHHEQDMFKMGGLARRLPFVFGVYLIGSLALTAIPPTAGFFSKDEILLEAYLSGHTGLWALALFGAFLTAVYTFRMVFLVFFGEAKSEVHPGHGIAHHLPLAVLAVMAVIGGFIHLPLGEILPAKGHEGAEDGNAIIEYLPLIVSLIGIGISAFLYLGDRKLAGAIARGAAPLHALFKNAMGFDWIYRQLFVKPYLGIVHVNRHDNIDVAIGGIPVLLRGLHALLARTENGYLRWYAASLGLGAALIAAAVIA